MFKLPVDIINVCSILYAAWTNHYFNFLMLSAFAIYLWTKKRSPQPDIVPVWLCLHHCSILKQCPYIEVHQVDNTHIGSAIYFSNWLCWQLECGMCPCLASVLAQLCFIVVIRLSFYIFLSVYSCL